MQRRSHRTGSSNGLLALALAEARRTPSERRSVVDRRVGTDRRSILRLADGQVPHERRRSSRRTTDGTNSA